MNNASGGLAERNPSCIGNRVTGGSPVRPACNRKVQMDQEGAAPPTVTLWRPVGPDEPELIRQSGMRAFPPRLPGQPIFYPVTSEEVAIGYVAGKALLFAPIAAILGGRGWVFSSLTVEVTASELTLFLAPACGARASRATTFSARRQYGTNGGEDGASISRHAIGFTMSRVSMPSRSCSATDGHCASVPTRRVCSQSPCVDEIGDTLSLHHPFRREDKRRNGEVLRSSAVTARLHGKFCRCRARRI